MFAEKLLVLVLSSWLDMAQQLIKMKRERFKLSKSFVRFVLATVIAILRQPYYYSYEYLNGPNTDREGI